jgi:CHAT domain-containing protein/tetratricopeptide (TPR) repeat protein
MVLIVPLCIHLNCFSQNLSNERVLQNLDEMDRNPSLRNSEKLQQLYVWKKQSEALELLQDSVYAMLLHRIGALEFHVNNNYNAAILFTLKALQINSSRKSGSSINSAVLDYYNLGFFYNTVNLLRRALLYYDSAIQLARSAPDIHDVIRDSRLAEAYIFFRMGDYEKAVEVSDLGIASTLEAKDSLNYLSFLNQRAQSLFFQNKLEPSLRDVQISIPLAQTLHEAYELASAYKTRSLIFESKGNLPFAESSLRNCIEERFKTKDFGQLAGDYIDLGNFYTEALKSFGQASTCYLTAIQFAKKGFDSVRVARASLNLGSNYLSLQKFDKAIHHLQQALCYLKIARDSDFLANPSLAELVPIGNKELVQVLFNAKTELLLELYKKSHDNHWLTACLRTALLNDSLIMEIRHEQLGEQSKLYWRDRTRGFFINAIEGSYLAHNPPLAFYFMEKSRSVLLQDNLNELGAHAFLPPEETTRLENFQVSIIELQEKLTSFPDNTSQYKALQIKLLQAKEYLEQNIKSLEQRYPAYYQYKYADNVKSLSSLQSFLAPRNQHFIDYFISDSASFALYITHNSTKFIKIENKNGNIEDSLTRFIKFCSDKNALNQNFSAFLMSSHRLYEMLFSPFRLPPGRVIICQDNNLIPFEALSADSVKADFLVNNYAFSYVYSGQYLMNQYENTVGKGDFLGIAPVHFSAYTGLADLRLSEEALKNCSAKYHQSTLLVNNVATRKNFIEQLSDYNTTTILTHAKADSLDEEPTLFMNDSVIHLSELQMLNKTASQLIVLSACQTNVGKNLNGEGIFSLARGFSSAGIPSVAATQWEADEQAIYAISEKFNEYISQGMNKDLALQKAKLYYILLDEKSNILPYYWAGMILIGNTEPVQFSVANKISWKIPTLIVSLILMIFLFYKFRNRQHPNV